MHDSNRSISGLLRVGLLLAGVLVVPATGCGDSPDDISAGTGASPTGGGTPGGTFPGGGATGWPGGSGPGDWPGGSGSGGWPGGDGPGDWPGGDWPGGDGPEGGADPDESGDPSESDDLHFTFVLPGASEPVSARLLGGEDGSSIVIDKYPKSYGFNLTYGSLAVGYPDQIDEEFCNEIEGYVEMVEAQDGASEMALQHLREFYPWINLVVRFGWPLRMDLRPAAIKAAHAAGATSSNLRLSKEPRFENLSLEMTFTNDALTRRMGDHQEAEKQFREQFPKNGGSVSRIGEYGGGMNWPDFLCDLYTNRVQMKISFDGNGLSTVAESQSLVCVGGSCN